MQCKHKLVEYNKNFILEIQILEYVCLCRYCLLISLGLYNILYHKITSASNGSYFYVCNLYQMIAFVAIGLQFHYGRCDILYHKITSVSRGSCFSLCNLYQMIGISYITAFPFNIHFQHINSRRP